MKKYNYILWDFNGTIFDDSDASRRATNILLKEHGLDRVDTVEKMRKHFCFPVKEYYKKLGFDFSVESYESMAEKWIKLYNDMSEQSGLCLGIRKALTEFNNAGYKQTIISACESNVLISKLNKLNITGYFDEVLGTDNFNAQSKIDIAVGWKNLHPCANAVMIGDSPHDYEVAVKINADCFLYTGGYIDRERLEKCGCTVIDDFKDLSAYISI